MLHHGSFQSQLGTGTLQLHLTRAAELWAAPGSEEAQLYLDLTLRSSPASPGRMEVQRDKVVPR